MLLLQCGHCHCNRQKGFAGSGGSDSEHYGVLFYAVNVFLLTYGFRLYGLALVGKAYAVGVYCRKLALLVLAHHGYYVIHGVLVYRIGHYADLGELLNAGAGHVHVCSILAAYGNRPFAVTHRNTESFFYIVGIGIKRSEQLEHEID